MKGVADIGSPILQNILNMKIPFKQLSDKLKLAHITSYSSKNSTYFGNYRLVNELPHVFTIFTRIMQSEFCGFIYNILSLYLYSYRKGFSQNKYY